MEEIKNFKIYIIIKRVFFSVVFLIYKILGIKNQKYYIGKWFSEDGDNKHLTNYPLTTKNAVVDVGGYLGVFSDRIINKYNPNVFIYEPVKSFYKILKNKYLGNKNVYVFNYGLSNTNSTKKIYLLADGSSLVKKGERSVNIKLVDVKNIFISLKKVDLMSINIEGAEYDVLERLINTGLIKKVKFLQVQFHSFIPEAVTRRQKIIREILKTHKKRFAYPFVWESFELRR